MKREEVIEELVARANKWCDEHLETYDDTYTTAEVVDELTIALPDHVRVEAPTPEYVYKDVLKLSKFYLDEAYDDGENHENANTCDMCTKPARYMTFSSPHLEPPQGEAYYLCETCVKKFKLEDLLDVALGKQ